jgi:tape measure domain-containing protein
LSANLSRRAMMAFGSALATVGKGKADLQGVILALTQIASKGKVSAEEINQINERVPQIRQAMIAAFGTADTEALGKLGITADVFLPKIIAQLEKLPGATGGAMNAVENLGDAFKRAIMPLGQGFLEMFQAAQKPLETFIKWLEIQLTRVGQVLAAIGRSGALTHALGSAIDDMARMTGLANPNAFATIAGYLLSVIKNFPLAFAIAANYAKVIGHNLVEAAKFVFAMLKETLNQLLMMSGMKGFEGKTKTQERGFIENNMVGGLSNLAGKLGLAGDLTKAAGLGMLLEAGIAAYGKVQKPNFQDVPDTWVLKNFASMFMKDAGMYAATVQGAIKPLQTIPDNMNFGGDKSGLTGKAGGAGTLSSLDKWLSEIEKNTRQTASALDLRSQTTGGGDLAAIGVTPQELHGLGGGTGNVGPYSEPSHIASDLERAVYQLVQNALRQNGPGVPTF